MIDCLWTHFLLILTLNIINHQHQNILTAITTTTPSFGSNKLILQLYQPQYFSLFSVKPESHCRSVDQTGRCLFFKPFTAHVLLCVSMRIKCHCILVHLTASLCNDWETLLCECLCFCRGVTSCWSEMTDLFYQTSWELLCNQSNPVRPADELTQR